MCRMRPWLSALVLAAVAAADPSPLAIGGFVPSSLPLGRGVVPALRLALRHTNADARLLRGYRLDIHWNDTQCDPAVGMKNFFDMLAASPPKVALLGAACTSVTDPIAKAAQFFELVQLSYADTHPMYTKAGYPNFFRVVPSEAAFNAARVALLREFNWTRVGTLFQNSPRYALPHSKLLTILDDSSVAIAAAHGLVDTELREILLKLKENDVRIILGNFDEEHAKKIFCEAYDLGMFGRRYQWILVGLAEQGWWQGAPCPQEHILKALEGYLATSVLPLSSSTDITISGLTSAEYAALYDEARGDGDYSPFHGYAYDGVWAVALALQAVLRKLRHMGSHLSLRDFRYRDPFWGRILREAFSSTSFLGVTGPVTFINNERRGLILVHQFQDGVSKKVAEYDSTEFQLTFSTANSIIWRGSGPPIDRTLVIVRKKRVALTIYVLLVTLAMLGIVLACVFLAVNIRFRNQKYIKMSSPYLNNVIIVGCMLTYTSVILLGLDSSLTDEQHFPIICAARAWVLMTGFTLAFGSMFSKTWRVHAIFTNIKLNKKVIKDYKLFLVVGVLVLIDVGILTTWQVLDPFYRETTNAAPETMGEDVQLIMELEFCQSDHMSVFLGSIYAYKGLLMAVGCLLAWETRHVSIPALNDSKYIGLSVYNVVMMCTLGAAVAFVLREQQDAAFLIISAFILFCSTTTLCLVFGPKVRLLIQLLKHPQEDRRVRATLKPFKKSHHDSEPLDDFGCLQQQNIRYRQRLEECKRELRNLTQKLQACIEPIIIISEPPAPLTVVIPPPEEPSSVVSSAETLLNKSTHLSSKAFQTAADFGELLPRPAVSSFSLQDPILQDQSPLQHFPLSCPDLQHPDSESPQSSDSGSYDRAIRQAVDDSEDVTEDSECLTLDQDPLGPILRPRSQHLSVMNAPLFPYLVHVLHHRDTIKCDIVEYL